MKSQPCGSPRVTTGAYKAWRVYMTRLRGFIKWQMAGSNPACSTFSGPGVEPGIGLRPHLLSGTQRRFAEELGHVSMPCSVCQFLPSLRVSIHAASAVLILLLTGCAMHPEVATPEPGQPHPVQPVPDGYTLPKKWAHCEPEGVLRLKGGRRAVIARCKYPDFVLMLAIDLKTGELIDEVKVQ